MHTRFVRALAIVVACACGAADVSAPTPSEVGSYALRTLDGSALPTTIMEGATPVTVTSGSITLSSGGGLQFSVVFQLSGQAATTNNLGGQYTRQGASLSFAYSNGGANTGSITGDTLRMTNEGVMWMFVRN